MHGLESYGARRSDAKRARSSMVEQGTHNPLVVGSNPTGPTRKDDMRRTRTETRSEPDETDGRIDAARSGFRASPVMLVAVAAVLVFAGFALGRFAFSAVGGRLDVVSSPEVEVGGKTVQAGAGASAMAAPIGAGMVEVPQLVGVRTDEAVVVLETAGFKVRVLESGAGVADPVQRVVLAQNPTATTVLSVDSTVTIVTPPAPAGLPQPALRRSRRRARPRGSCASIRVTRPTPTPSSSRSVRVRRARSLVPPGVRPVW